MHIVALLLLLCFPGFTAQEPAPPTQLNTSPDVSIRPQSCPEPAPGVEIVFPIQWEGVSAKMVMPAEVNAILNKFTAKQCEKYGKDITGKITGVKGAPLPQPLWTINLIVATYSELTRNIIESNPAEYGDPKTKAAAEAKVAAEQAVKEAKEETASKALSVTISVPSQ